MLESNSVHTPGKPVPAAITPVLELIGHHAAALAALDALVEEKRPGKRIIGADRELAATAALDAARDALLAHRPASHDEVQAKLAYFRSCRCFYDWDDFELEDMLASLTLAS